MTKEQAITKLGALPLLAEVEVEYEDDMETGAPTLTFRYDAIPGPGEITIGIPILPSTANFEALAAALPLLSEDRLASLAILLSPSLPGDEVIPE